ncbi:cytochrome C assembly family protein [Virgibacillus sp. W0181]|uniref:cytochrome C assembly family protein n=1 Tax=Virgibacillus sp. W0181 TaxID=3391581 RepID=UPI003F470DA5
MFAAKWLYEIILLIYGMSLLGYFIDFIKSNRKLNKISFWLLSIVWLIQTIILYNQAFVEKNFPILTLNDGLFFYAWILILFSLIINRLYAIHFIILFTNLFSFFILLLAISLNAQDQVHPQGVAFVHEILIIHITLAIISYGFFTISFLLALMYLLQYQFIKRKKGIQWIWRFGDLSRLNSFAFTFVMIGVPLLLIGVILGVVWAYVSGAEFYWFDLKTIGSILVLGVYILYLILWVGKGYRGKPISIYNVAAFLVLLINFFLFGVLSNFHFKPF